jgi:fluoride ion exporter CrcB/FEX
MSQKKSTISKNNQTQTTPKTPQPQDQTQVFNLLLYIICGALIILGLYEVFTERVEDGLINIIIGSGLIGIPITNNGFSYNTAKLYQKVLVFALSIFVVGATLYLIYLGFNN